MLGIHDPDDHHNRAFSVTELSSTAVLHDMVSTQFGMHHA